MHLLDHMPYLSGAICSNGALVIDAKSRRVVHQAVLGPKLLRSVVASVRDRFGPVPIAVDYIAAGSGRISDPDWPGLGRPFGDWALWPLDPSSLPKRLAACLMIRGDWREFQSLAVQWRVTVTSSAPGLVEISAPAATKLDALRSWCTSRGFDLSEVIAFGDMPNDVGLLQKVGRGIAVQNAHPAVIGAADAVTESNNRDGVATYLAREILRR